MYVSPAKFGICALERICQRIVFEATHLYSFGDFKFFAKEYVSLRLRNDSVL